MSESKSRYFSYQEAASPEVLLSLARNMRKNIQRFFERQDYELAYRDIDPKDEVLTLLERCEAVLTLLEYEMWLNCDDGK